MNYIEWIKTIGLAIQLLIKSEFGSDVTVSLEWQSELKNGISLGDNQPALYVSIYNQVDSAKLACFYLIPWQNIYFNDRTYGNDLSLPTYALKTVNEFAVVYEDFSGLTADEELRGKVEKVNSLIDGFFEIIKNQKVLKEEQNFSTESGVQIIKTKEFPYYIVIEIALPGTSGTLPIDFDWVPPGKMILTHLVPDFGQVKSQWQPSLKNVRNDCLNQSDEEILKVFNSSLTNLLQNDTLNRTAEFNISFKAVKNILREKNCDGNATEDYYKSYLKKLMGYYVEEITDLPYSSPFGNYQPKQTPDELFDYMPSVYDEVAQLPSAELSALPKLIPLYRKYRKLARKNKGEWVEGNMILGANPTEYKPSFNEIMLCEVGRRIQKICKNNSPNEVKKYTKRRVGLTNRIKFQDFRVLHSDVMGSGRFFYVDIAGEVNFKLF